QQPGLAEETMQVLLVRPLGAEGVRLLRILRLVVEVPGEEVFQGPRLFGRLGLLPPLTIGQEPLPEVGTGRKLECSGVQVIKAGLDAAKQGHGVFLFLGLEALVKRLPGVNELDVPDAGLGVRGDARHRSDLCWASGNYATWLQGTAPQTGCSVHR